MSVALFPAKMSHKATAKMRRLNEIAEFLGVPVSAFDEPAQPYVLYTQEDGTRWLLELDNQGTPTVRLDGSAAANEAAGEDIPAFLIRDVGSPQHQALLALIERLLVMHLAHR